MSQKIRIINQELDNFDTPEIVGRVHNSIEKYECLTIATINPEFMVLSAKDKKFAETLTQFDIKTADGFGIVFMSALFGNRFKQRITGADLTLRLLREANQNNYKVVMLGASEESSQKACAKIRSDFPGLKIDCLSGGIIDPEHIDDELINKLRDAKPDILFVGLGAPKQEYFIVNIIKSLKIPVAIGVGGTIDFISGFARRAPKWMQNIGLEWLWRLFTQPARFGRIFKATIIFPWYYLLWKLKG